MRDTDMLSGVAGLLGEPARTRILTALLGGCALTAKELAYFAGVGAPTASSHLSRLVGGDLLVMEKQGRCHYYRIKSAEVAHAIEGLMVVASAPRQSWPPNHRVEPALRDARLCYDHLAGRLGVALCDMLQRRGHVVLMDEGGEVTPSGARFLTGLGVDLPGARRARRHYCRGCIDWTERRHHISGAVGAALAATFLERRWIVRVPDSRVLTVTARGREKLAELKVADYAGAPAPPRLRVVAGRA
ncbi:MAG TPA: winged helix-turn-helix domain-containing protein [Methylomirabilota bacterium]|nr:winged helix-turn-helix domain-containing protein [Methylomirabilota bacterium]